MGYVSDIIVSQTVLFCKTLCIKKQISVFPYRKSSGQTADGTSVSDRISMFL